MKQRIFAILRVLAWLAALALCCLPPVFTASPAGYLPLLSFLIFSGLSLLYLLLLRERLDWSDAGGFTTCTRGDNMDFSLALRNRSWMVYPYVRVKLVLSDLFGGVDSTTDTVMTLAPHEERAMDLDVAFDHIGEYSVSVRELRVRGLMGVISLSLTGGEEHRVLVMPQIWQIAALPLSQKVIAEDSRAHTSSNIDGMDYIGVREYELGDQIKNIHWKLSAHSNSYMTKLTETLGTSGLTVILDLYSSEADPEVRMCLYDGLVEGALALCAHAMLHNMENDLTFFNRTGERAMRQLHQGNELERIIFDLPRITARREEYPVESLLEHAARGLYVKNNVALVTSQINSEMIRYLQRIRSAGRKPMLLFVLPEGLSQRQREERLAPLQQLTASEIPWHAFSDPQTLEGGRL